MISWIQRYFQKHFRIIFAVLLAGMVVPFIFTIGSTPGIGRADRSAVTQDYFGHNLASPSERARLFDEANLSGLLQYGPGLSPDQLQFFAYRRAAALHLADDLRLPPATQSQIEDRIRGLRLFAGANGQFDAARYENFRSRLKSAPGASEGDVARVIAEDVRIAEAEKYVAGPGYATPWDVKDILLKTDTQWTVSTAAIDYANFKPDIHLSDADIAKFFSDNPFRYTISPRVIVDAVEFPAAAYVSQVNPSDAEVRQYYQMNRSKFPKAAPKFLAAKADPEGDFAAVAPQVKAAIQLEAARRSAVKAASDVAFALYDGKVSQGPALDSFLAAHNLKLSPVAPFDRDTGPAEFGGSPEIAQAAFALGTERYYSEGLPTPDGAVVLIWRQQLPERQPALAEVAAKVRADALDNEKRKRFVELGRTLKAAIERGLKSGESFENAATQSAGGLQVALKSYPAFTLRTPPQGIDQSVIGTLDRLSKGSVSDMEIASDKGYFVYAADKRPPLLDDSNPRYQQAKAQIATAYAQIGSSDVVNELVDSELKRSGVVTH